MTATAVLAVATIVFVGTHFLMSHPLRLTLVRALGENGFRLAYSVVAFVTFGAMMLSFGEAENLPLWIAPSWWWPAASLIMLVATILLLGSFVRNPAFPHPGAEKFAAREPGGVFAITRHPMNWSFILWALVHLSLWGSPRNLIVATGILVLALFGSIGQDRKKLSTVGPAWRGWMARTSFVPFGALLRGKLPWRAAKIDWRVLAAGFAAWLIVTALHAPSASPPGWLGLL